MSDPGLTEVTEGEMVWSRCIYRTLTAQPRNSYGYNETHRCQLPEQRYPSCLTDAKWALVADLFEAQGGRGVPPRHSRRTLLEAC